MPIINHFNDNESKRHQQSYNERQKKNYHRTKEGVIVNAALKDSINSNQNDLLHDYILPSDSIMFDEDLEYKAPKRNNTKTIALLCASALGVMGAIAGGTKIAHVVAKKKVKKPSWETLPDIGRNINLNKDADFVTYMAVQNPQVKTVLGAAAYFTFAATAFVMKNFTDGFKDTWVKKQNADTDYLLQDKLINVETKLFKGKNEIIRSMMHQTSEQMQSLIDAKDLPKSQKAERTFEGFLSFKGQEKELATSQSDKKKSHLKNILISAGTLMGAVGLGIYSFKNIKKTGKLIEQNYHDMHQKVSEILTKAPDDIMKKHKDTVKELFISLNFKPEEMQEKLKKAGIEKDEIDGIVKHVTDRTRIFSPAPELMGGVIGKIQYNTYVDEPSGHFYNWAVNMDSKPLGMLAMSVAGVGASGYAGQKAVEAVREVEVKKVNNDTELSYHKKLVNVELRNFKNKKESYIKPLVEEVKKQAPQKSKAEVKEMAQKVLYEIKNGPPYVYS